MKKPRILLGDDESHVIELLKIILEDYDVVVADNGEEVLEFVDERKPDLILLDVMMPKINGFEVCEVLKKDKKTKDITIAILSAKGQERDIVQGLKLGADYYITKPFHPMELKQKVKEMLK